MKALNRLQEQLTTFVERVEFISYLVDAEAPSIADIPSAAEASTQGTAEFIELAGMSPSVVRQYFDLGLLVATGLTVRSCGTPGTRYVKKCKCP